MFLGVTTYQHLAVICNFPTTLRPGETPKEGVFRAISRARGYVATNAEESHKKRNRMKKKRKKKRDREEEYEI